MSKHCLKLAFIGGGANSAVGYVHFSAAQLDNRFKVVAGAFSRDSEHNLLTAQQWGIEAKHTYSNWQTMLEKERQNIDAVVVLTPTPHHLEVLETLFKLNIPTICEKSLVCGSDEMQQLAKCYNPKKHFLAVTFNYSGYAMIRELKNLIKLNKLGDIQKIHLEMPQEGFKRPPEIAGKASPPQSWRLQDYAVPTICLDLGVHLHHLSSYLLDLEPTQTSALYATHSQYPNLVDDVQMLLKYPNNITGSMWMSKTAIGHRNGLKVRVYGTEGSATWYQLNPDELELYFNDGRREILDRAGQCQYAHQFRYNRMKPGHPTGFVEAFANLYTDIHQALCSYLNSEENANEYVFGFDQARDGLALFEAATRSNQSGSWEAVK
ncbi:MULTISPECIES: Gfo/Idh/MocA family protein [Pseudoalteromonas]|uniref:Gfo/Idh/MocA family oxidoreductase n=1 Tax=Pseudoalteromonas obscura TaxID=3048491 RepID=A0ABT7ETR7_9GAMM|nr:MULTISPECIES: Gfo/Idh/MocA family oxidoreductase [Pseudoalteromonas]MBQ4837008.1 Gfo/Idh/MocA family oxidoreductase [Pseudoalteromonas luteoviolacea]MDK2598449.1 Gfo/Idh/MocA family oxidoreductase [Pseudoalteromonas sp. P94(2023)]